MSISSIYINSSSRSSSSSSIPAADLVSKLNQNLICSCVVGISSIKFSSLNKNIAHSALLLLPVDCDNNEGELGILIEYGDYSPKMATTEEEYTKKGLVVYRYGEKGGLRYYIKKYGRFIEEFGDLGYIDLNIHSDNQISFDTFLDKIAKLEDNKWTLNNYSAIYNFNCQNFAIEALHELNPHFVIGNIYPKDPNLAAKKSKKKLDFVPSNIKEELLKLYKNGKK